MSWFGADKSIDASSKVVAEVGKAIDGIFTSDQERLTHQEAIARLENAPHEVMGKLSIIEAQHRSIFVAGWRPAVGWICAAGIGFAFIVNPLLERYTQGNAVEVPLDMILELVLAMLGMGALRTVEKVKGITK
jgi:hypothetical protein